MNKRITIGDPTAPYLRGAAIQEGRVYATSDGYMYRVLKVNTVNVSLVRIMKSGRTAKTGMTRVYGMNCFFEREVEMPIPPEDKTGQAESTALWRQSGRLFSRNGIEMFSIIRHEGLSPTQADKISKKIAQFLNLMDDQ